MKVDRTILTVLLIIGLIPHDASAVNFRNASEEVAKCFREEIIIGNVDNRMPSRDPRVGRITDGIDPSCTGWILSNGAFLTAGHCVLPLSEFTFIEFNVPYSSLTGVPKPSAPENRYKIDHAHIQYQHLEQGGFVKDWAVFAVGTNDRRQVPIERQDAFYRPWAVAPAVAEVTVTGYGLAGPPPGFGTDPLNRNQLSQVQQSASGPLQGIFVLVNPQQPNDNFFNLHYLVDTKKGNSGSPITTGVMALGIHSTGSTQAPVFNLGTSFKDEKLAATVHSFPGTLLDPQISGANIFYVDYYAPQYVAQFDGNIFTPFSNLTQAFERVAHVATNTLISVVRGNYPEENDPSTGLPRDIDVRLQSDTNLTLPVGSVNLWALASNQP